MQVGTREKGHACHRLPGVAHNVIMAEKKIYYFARWEQPRLSRYRAHVSFSSGNLH
ncbi:hypothetical protein M408DRAFT_236514 [Serendipita vermifera MAFF 305830]|uniref:Uncharacterized protein n=1 Tax=Serendipita vermifera MAFF 305830 TaxID=933852 RepID=A0A0C2XRY4_SERVB|nr:hypothetical protein M408DRAFT_236514 [Serendipita vermifera MAFF 305830]